MITLTTTITILGITWIIGAMAGIASALYQKYHPSTNNFLKTEKKKIIKTIPPKSIKNRFEILDL